MAFASPLHGPFHSLQGEEREGVQEKAQRGHFCTAAHEETWLRSVEESVMDPPCAVALSGVVGLKLTDLLLQGTPQFELGERK